MQTLQQAMASLGMSVVRQGNGWRTEVTFPEDFPAFQGHFPGHPILPGVVQILVGLHVLSVGLDQPVVLHDVIQSKFLAQVEPGQPIAISVEPLPPDTEGDLPDRWDLVLQRADASENPGQPIARCRLRVEYEHAPQS